MRISVSRVVTTVLGTALEMEGNITSDGEVIFHGTFKGNLIANKLTLGKDAVVEGRIDAQAVVINGAFSGILSSTSVFLSRTASVNADVTCVSMEMEAGAVYSGHARHVDVIVPAPELAVGTPELIENVSVPPPAVEVWRVNGSPRRTADRNHDGAITLPIAKR